jgi:hypothetical protein
MADSSDASDEGAFLSHLAALLSTGHKIAAVVDGNPSLKHRLRDFDPLRSAALVAGLLTEPSLHANTIRIEYLVHVLLAFAAGEREPGRPEVDHWINVDLAASVIALMEDPPEDVFLSNVITPNGNFRIFEGVWETGDFYLQRILNVLETLPISDVSRLLRQEVFAVLKLSEDTAARRGIVRFSSGGGAEKQKASIPSSKQLQALSNAIVYSTTDLERLDILPADLEPFTFPLSDRSKLVAQTLGDSDLEKRPIVYDGTNWIVLLPTAVSVAVRQHILTWMQGHGLEASFNRVFVEEYRRFLSQIDIVGTLIPPRASLVPSKIASKALLETSTEVDSGRYLQLIAVIDSLESFVQHGFSSQDFDVSEISEEIESRVRDASTHFRQQESFRQGLTLVVWCGYGRPAAFRILKESTDWWIETVSAPDIDTLSWASHSSQFSPWKLIGHYRYLSGNNVFIANANGLLNLYGWWRQTRCMMLDHQMEFRVGRQLNILIPTDCIKKIRVEVRQNLDCHVEPLPDGKMLRVIRKTWDRYFPESRPEPSYGCIEAISAGKLLGSYVGENFIWWLAADPVKTKLPRDLVFRIWDAASHWLERAVPILEPDLALTEGALLIDLDFSDAQETQADVISGDALESCILVSVEAHTRTVQIIFRDPFLGAFGQPKNIGEREILRALTQGVLALGGRTTDDLNIDRYLDRIIPNEDARHLHLFKAAHFRDYIHEYDRPKSLFIDEADDARCKLGLGWLVQNPDERTLLTGREESVEFLNRVVATIWERIRPKFHELDRLAVIVQSLRYVEGIEAERLQWERTVRAVVALEDDKVAAKNRVVREITRFNAAALVLRLIVEMAISESPLAGGRSAGILDVQSLMSDVFLMFHLGGCSDAVKKGAMEPEIRIAPNGDIITHDAFLAEIVEPFGVQFAMTQVEHETSTYDKHFEWVESIPSVQDTFPEQFWKAIKGEFSLSIDEVRGFRDTLEQWALEQRKCVFVASREDIISYCAASTLTSAEVANVALNQFELWPRGTWDSTPKGFKRKDWYAWRFGRRLSLIWRPLLRVEDSGNPRYVISPGLIGTNLMHVLRLYYEGLVPTDQCRTSSMKRWVGEELNRRGHAFASKVFDALQSLGYKALLEIKLDGLLNEKLTRDFGDVDVLAWRPTERQVLAIECKDLRLAKTPNEIAEQLNYFTGQILPNGERDDLLKHIDRCNLLKERSRELSAKLGTRGEDIEIQTLVCFSHPVPMQYVRTRLPEVSFLTLEDLKLGKL